MEEPIYTNGTREYKLLKINDPRFTETYCLCMREQGEVPWSVLGTKSCGVDKAIEWFTNFAGEVWNAKRRP